MVLDKSRPEIILHFLIINKQNCLRDSHEEKKKAFSLDATEQKYSPNFFFSKTK